MIEHIQSGGLHSRNVFPSQLSLQRVDSDSEPVAFSPDPPDTLVSQDGSEAVPLSQGIAESSDIDTGKKDFLKKLACTGLATLSFLGGLLGSSAANAAEKAQIDRPGIERVLESASEKPEKKIQNTKALRDTTTANPSKSEIKTIIESTAKKHKVPSNILLAIAWKESGWHHYNDNGTVVEGRNLNKKGKLISTDWGIMQVNDHAHPQAFPRAKEDIRYNIDFSVRLLKSLHKEQGSWQKAIRAYNGSDAYARSISQIMKAKPWLKG